MQADDDLEPDLASSEPVLGPAPAVEEARWRDLLEAAYAAPITASDDLLPGDEPVSPITVDNGAEEDDDERGAEFAPFLEEDTFTTPAVAAEGADESG